MPCPSDKVIVVTGEPRSGTSAMMAALRLIGQPIAGDRFPSQPIAGDAARAAARDAALAKLNPNGFWEVPGVVVRGLAEVDGLGGRAVKIISRGLLPGFNRRGPTGTDPALVWRYVICTRNPRHTAESQRDLRGPVDVPGPAAGTWANHRGRADPARYLAGAGRLVLWLADRELDDWASIDYDDVLDQPAASILRIATHLGRKVTPAQLAEAAASYDPTLRRSPATAPDNWPEPVAVDGQAADLVYDALRTLDRAQLETAALAVLERQEAHQLENAKWYSAEVGWMSNAAIERRIRRDPAYREQLRRAAMDGIRTGHHPQVCDGYEEVDDAPIYTIRRPADLGDYRATMVRFRGQVVTRENAFLVHQAGLADPDTPNPPVDQQRVAAWRWSWR